MVPRTPLLAFAVSLALAASGCVGFIPDIPQAPQDGGPAPKRTVAELYSHGTPEGEVEIHDLALAHGLDVKIDVVAGRRILTNGANEVIVLPGERSVTINKMSYPLTGEVRWRNGKIFLPGDARVVFGEHVRTLDVPSVRDTGAELDGIDATAYGHAGTPRPVAPLKSAPLSFDRNVPPLPASWNVAANRAWSYIVVHHSATLEGGAKSFNAAHAKKWQHGLGYHFVIGNGSETRDGEVEIGSRWIHQNEGIHGAHAGVDRYNQHGIGICLVGDFDREQPTAKQLASLRELCRVLIARYGITRAHVIGHRSVRSGHTDCPGFRFPLDALVRSL